MFTKYPPPSSRAAHRCTARSSVLWGAVLAATLFSIGCASQPAAQEPVTAPASLRQAASLDPNSASPASRDALSKGLRWILEDAPTTRIQSPPPSPWAPPAAPGDGP